MSHDAVAALEALLFASDTSLEWSRIGEVLERGPDEVRQAVEALRASYDAPGRGLALVEVAGGLRLVTRPEVAPVLLRLQRLRSRSRLSRAAVETLAIIAYRQPVSRADVEQVRGVGAESVLTHLLERRLVRIVGRRPGPGRPILYGTTSHFLEHFGLRDLGELPPFETGESSADPEGMAATTPPDGGAADVEEAEGTAVPEPSREAGGPPLEP